MNNISDDLKKVFLAGIGAAALTFEKSKESKLYISHVYTSRSRNFKSKN